MPSLVPLRSVQFSSTCISSIIMFKVLPVVSLWLRMMLVCVWFRLHWALSSFFSHYVHGSVSRAHLPVTAATSCSAPMSHTGTVQDPVADMTATFALLCSPLRSARACGLSHFPSSGSIRAKSLSCLCGGTRLRSSRLKTLGTPCQLRPAR